MQQILVSKGGDSSLFNAHTATGTSVTRAQAAIDEGILTRSC
jgi:hypothetical protein